MNSQRRKSLVEVNTLARSAQVKMVRECQRADMDLRHVVGHANFLDHLKHLTLQAHLEFITEAPAPKRSETVHTSAKEVSDDDLDYSDDEVMTFESISYSQPVSTVTVVVDDDSDSNSDSSDTSDDDTALIHYPKSPSRPPPSQPLERSKPIDVLQPTVSVRAVEVL